MKKIVMYTLLIMLVLTACKSTKKSSDNLIKYNIEMHDSIFVMDIVDEYNVLDTTKYNPAYEGLLESMKNNFSKTLLIHDDSRVSKITFDEHGKTMIHLLFDSEKNVIKYYSEVSNGQPYYTEFKIDTMFQEDMIPMMKKKIEDDGVLTIDSSNHVDILGYDCFRINFRPDENTNIDYYLTEQIPRFEGILGAMLNTQFDFSLKVISESREDGIRILKQPKNKRVDETMEKYLTLNSTTYLSKE